MTLVGLANWNWEVFGAEDFITGDGAVAPWRDTGNSKIATVSIPVSPTRMLYTGRKLEVLLDTSIWSSEFGMTS